MNQNALENFLASVPPDEHTDEHLVRHAEGIKHALTSKLFKIKKNSIKGIKDSLTQLKVE